MVKKREPVTLFISYAHEDDSLHQKLEKHLSLLKHQGLISTWHDRQILPGMNWAQEIDGQLNKASVILLLVSSDFLASNYCYGIEMQRALARHEAEEAHVIPILLRPVDWESAPFAHLMCLPSNTSAITLWDNEDAAFQNVTRDIRKIIESICNYSESAHLLPQSFQLPFAAKRLALTYNIQYRQRLISCVRALWINGVLEQSLHNEVILTLGLYELPHAVENPWRLIVQESNLPARPLPSDTRIIEVYNETEGELLILGEPGAGKTTLLLELARDLLDRATSDTTYPIPVVFNLTSWAMLQQPLSEWLVEELASKYQVPRKLGRSWISNDEIQPLLDGLDEVTLSSRSACINAINAYRRKHNLAPLIVCSRSTEYLAQTERLLLRKAVVIQPLTPQQIDTYLTSAGKELADIRIALQADPHLQELMSTPLILSILTLAYHGETSESLATGTSLAAKRQHLFKKYVERMFQRRSVTEHYTLQQTTRWLAWLAKQLVQDGQCEFYIENMQLGWIPSSRLRLLCRINIYLIIMFFYILLGFFTKDMLYTCSIGIMAGLVVSISKTIQPTGRIIWSWNSIKQNIVQILLVELFFFSSLKLTSLLNIESSANLVIFIIPVIIIAANYQKIMKWLSSELEKRYPAVLRLTENYFVHGGLIVSLIISDIITASLTFGINASLIHQIAIITFLQVLTFGFSDRTLEKQDKIKPNLGIKRSAWNAFRVGLLSSLFTLILSIFSLTISLGSTASDIFESLSYSFKLLSGQYLIYSLSYLVIIYDIPSLISSALSFGLMTGLTYGGYACLQHITLRLYLWYAKLIPFNYQRFLDYATERILLRKVGGGYIFVHRTLLDYFALLEVPDLNLEVSRVFRSSSYFDRAYKYLRLKQIENAHADFTKASSLATNDVNTAWMVIYTSLQKIRPGKDTAADLEHIAMRDLQSYAAQICRGVALGLNDKLYEGLAELEQALQRNPSLEDAYFWKGMFHAYLGQDSIAAEAINRALEAGLPPILLTPLYWLEQDRPQFYLKYASPLLILYDI